MKEIAELASELCRQCALCCNGAIHDVVLLREGEDEALPEAFRSGDSARLKQPCARLCGQSCSIYPDRPSSCRAYTCHVLERYQSGALTFDRARAVIDQALAMAGEARALLDEGEDLVTQRRRWRNSAREKASNPAFHLTLLRLNLLIDREFRRSGKRLMRSTSA